MSLSDLIEIKKLDNIAINIKELDREVETIVKNLVEKYNTKKQFIQLNNLQKIVQVKYKIKYLHAIKSGIAQNKNKIPNLSEGENLLNLVLHQYGQRKIILS